MNTRAASFYREHGVQQVAEAYEKERVEDAVLMFCKHCLRYSMGWCPIHQRVRSPYKEPYYLVSNDGKRFRLEFDCIYGILRSFFSAEKSSVLLCAVLSWGCC